MNTKEADSRSTNIMDLLERGKYTTDQALQGLCESLASTGNPIPIYCCMARIAPEAVPNLLKIADTEGESLELARRLWDDLDHEGSVTLPAWMDKYDVGSVYHVHNPAELELLSCLIRYYREFYDTKDIVLEEGEPYTVYPDLEGLRYYGFGEQVTVSLPAGSEWDFWTRDIQFHHVHFAGPCADFFRKERASRKEQAQAAQEQGRKKTPWPCTRSVPPWGTAKRRIVWVCSGRSSRTRTRRNNGCRKPPTRDTGKRRGNFPVS